MDDRAQAFIELAKLFATVAGFFVVVSGIFFSMSAQIQNQQLELAGSLEKQLEPLLYSATPLTIEQITIMANLTARKVELINEMSQINREMSDLANGFLYSGIAFVGIALSVWGYAYSIVRRKEKKRRSKKN